MPDMIDETEYPPNSRKSRIEGEEPKDTEKRVEKVTKGTVIKKKKSFLDNVAETFFGDDAKSVASYVFYDVLIPAAKNTITEMVSSGIEMLLFGEPRGNRNLHRDKGKTYVSYGSYFKDRDERRGGDRQELSYKSRALHKFDDVIIETRPEAEEVLSGLVDLIETYGVATVADFYDLVGFESDYSDNKYGWTNLRNAVVQRVRDGYVILLPKSKQID